MNIQFIEIPAGPGQVHTNIFLPLQMGPEPMPPKYGVFFPAQDLPGVYQSNGKMSATCRSHPPVEYLGSVNWSKLKWAFDKLDLQNLPRDRFFRDKALRLEVALSPYKGNLILFLRKVWVYL